MLSEGFYVVGHIVAAGHAGLLFPEASAQKHENQQGQGAQG